MNSLTKKEIIGILLLAGILFLISGCSGGISQNNTDGKSEITASVIEDTKENCRLNNESDCRPIEIRRGENEKKNNIEEAAISDNNTKKITNIPEEFLYLNCTGAWKCVQSNYRAYQFSNCSWTSVEYCVYGCKNGTCNPPPVCKTGSMKCDKDNLVMCNEDGSEWTLNKSCDYQCSDGTCMGKNETPKQNDFLSDNCISVPDFNYAPAGNNLSNEYFTLKNSCSYSVDMGGWTARDNTTLISHIFTFPAFNLNVNAELSIHTGNGINTSADLYWGRGNASLNAIWNNGNDVLYLDTSNGTSVLICPYPNNGSISNCPDL